MPFFLNLDAAALARWVAGTPRAGLLSILISTLCLAGCGKPAPKLPPPPDVRVMTATTRMLPIYRTWVGSIQGAQNAEIQARVPGYLFSIEYQEGSLVKAGQPLFQIDPRPYQAALAEAEAQLAAATAKAELAKITLDRQTELFKNRVISPQEFDVAQQTAQADLAAVHAAQANVETARLNLEFCSVIAPFDGIAGKAQAQVGDLVGPGASSVLTTISQINPIKVVFFISEQEYLLARPLLDELEALPLEKRPRGIEILLSTGQPYPHKGVFFFLNRQVEPRTGTIEVVTLFPNPDALLRPGQFAEVRAHVATLKDAVLVPQRAVQVIQGSIYQLAVLGPNNTVTLRAVTPGPRHGAEWVIKEGLKPGEVFVAEGTQKLRDGMVVKPVPFEPAPTSQEPPAQHEPPPAHQQTEPEIHLPLPHQPPQAQQTQQQPPSPRPPEPQQPSPATPQEPQHPAAASQSEEHPVPGAPGNPATSAAAPAATTASSPSATSPAAEEPASSPPEPALPTLPAAQP